MGIIADFTPGIKTSRSAPRTNSSLEEITALTIIHIKFYKDQSNSIRQVRYDVFDRREIGNQSWKLDILSKDFWSLRFCGS